MNYVPDSRALLTFALSQSELVGVRILRVAFEMEFAVARDVYRGIRRVEVNDGVLTVSEERMTQ